MLLFRLFSGAEVSLGGDNFFVPFKDFITLDTQDEVLVQYIQTQSPVDIELDGRIAVVDAPGGGNATEEEDPTATESGAGSSPTAEDVASRFGTTAASAAFVGAIVAVFMTLL